MHQKGCMSESGSESVSDKEDSKSESSGSGSGSDSESGSSSSGSESGGQSYSGKSTNDDINHHRSDNARTSSQIISSADNHSDKGSSEEQSTNKSRNRSKSRKLSSEVWEENPDVYGIRRSARSRKEPQRLKILDSDSSDRPKGRRNNRKKSNSWNSDESSESEPDSGSPPPPSKRPGQRSIPLRKKKPARRRNKFSSDDEETSDGSDEDSKRTNTRTRTNAATVSYKEASDEQTDSSDLLEVDGAEGEAEVVEEEEHTETIERVLAQRRGKKGVTGSITTFYYIEENGDANADCDPNDPDSTEPQYLIKWKGWAHIHNTWESEKSLTDQKVKGMKKLENFIKRETELSWWRQNANPEEIDYYECQQELQQDLVSSYNSVERIIAEQYRETETGQAHEYLCKWESLPYAEATWEDTSLITKRWPKKVEEYLSREAAKTTPSRHCPVLRRRPKFQPYKEQPEYLGGASQGLILRDYQMDGLNWLIHSWCKENSVILADEMGLGKTIQTISFLYTLFRSHQMYGPFLCVVPLSTMTAWQREFQLWAPEINVVTYLGDVVSRDIIRQFEWIFQSSKRLKFNAILTTYEILLKDRQFLCSYNWACLLVDEAHRLKNDDSLLYKALKQFETNHRLLVTGTPLQNSLKELWALLHFIMPFKFDSWEEFEREHGNAQTKGYERLHKQLEPFILRRQKKDVEKSLPAKVEQILRVEMTSIQKQYYKWILTKNFSALRKGVKGSINTFINIVIELKKCCNHALLTKPDEYDAKTSADDSMQRLLKGSGKLLLLDKLLCRLKETGHRVLIFSQMVRMLDILAEYLQKRHFSFQRLDGSIKGEIRKQALDHFNAEGSQDFCFLLSTRAGGLGINLATADTVIIFDSDWNPQNDLQAQARAHRIGQKNQVNIYRLVTARSVEEDIVERAKRKMVLDHLVIQRMDTTGRTVLDKKDSNTGSNPFNKEDLNAILKFGAEELFKDDDDADEDPVCDIDEILRRAETRDEGPAMVGDELLSAFKVASFAFDEEQAIKESTTPVANDPVKDWDDIIPDDVKKNIEQEEKNKEMEDLYLPPRSRKTLQANSSDRHNRKRGHSAEAVDAGDGDDEDWEGSSGSDDDRPKKRGRPPANQREKIKGFTDQEIRRFVKSYKKFSAPLKHLDSIACDAELEEKPLAELKKLGEILQERCRTIMSEDSAAAEGLDTKEAAKRARKTFKLAGVPVNAKTLAACEAELAPLDVYLPSTKEERLKWQLDFRTRPANFDVDWDVAEDSKLLAGIYQYGMGSWEAIKMDSSLGIGDKILSNDEKKPQAKHLQSRAEYLLKVLKKLQDQKNGKQKQRKPRVKKGKEPMTKDTVDDDHMSTDGGDDKKNHKAKEKNEKNNKHKENDWAGDEKEEKREKKKGSKKEKKNKNSKKKPAGPMHFTANTEPRALEVLGDLDPAVFEECKEKMRPVKKALKALDNPDQSLSESDLEARIRSCLEQIGKQIDICLKAYPDPEKKVEWRSNLWYFVSKFTNFEAKQLYKLYKYGLKKEQRGKSDAEKNGGNPQSNNNMANHDKAKLGKIAKIKNKETETHERSRKDSSSRIEKDRERNRSEKERSNKSGESRASSSHKRKLEDGECEPEPNENKRHGRSLQRSRSRERRSGSRSRERRRRYEQWSNSAHYQRYRAPHGRPHDNRRYQGGPGYGSMPPQYGGYYDAAVAGFPRGYPPPVDWREYPDYKPDYYEYDYRRDRRPPPT